jgi:hypothetical protein
MTTSKDVKELYEHEYLIKVIEPQIIRQNQDFLLDKQNK